MVSRFVGWKRGMDPFIVCNIKKSSHHVSLERGVIFCYKMQELVVK